MTPAKKKEFKVSRVDRALLSVFPTYGMRRLYARHTADQLSAYRSSSTNRLRKNWAMGDAEADPAAHERGRLVERSRDANRNDPVASGATDTLGHNIVGTGLRPQSALRPELLGISEKRAKVIRTQIESAFERFSAMSDAANILSFDEQQFLALRKTIEDGEVLAIPTWANEPWRPFGRCIELIEGPRLMSPLRGADSAVRNGIRFGDRNQPLEYWIRKYDRKLGRKTSDFQRISARDDKGRPKILHVFQQIRPTQSRGIPYFAPVLTYFKDLADYLEAEIVAARIAACLAVFISKQDPMGLSAATGTGTETTTGKRIQGIEPGMVGYLGLNEEIKVVDPKRPGDAFPAFVETMFRIIGVSLGLPYELIAKDFSKTTYSSARASLLEGRRMFKTWRKWFAARFCQPIWNLVIEEAYLRDMIEVTDFYENFHEYTRCQWIGGGWGWVDPVKEIQASKDAIDYGLSTHAEEVGAQGRDWQEVLEQRKREQDFIKDLDVEIMSKTTVQPTGQTVEKQED
jgi:lambda family phage portal protein